jgi:bifunctional non-homologous end joining protein LigD
MPRSIAPMLAVLSELPPDQENHSFEFKWDGVRAIAFIEKGHLRLASRNQLDITLRYPELDDLPQSVNGRSVILDGEIVAFDESGAPSFALLQNRMHVADRRTAQRLMQHIPIRYFVFDLLYHDGRDLMPRPLTERRSMLEEVLDPSTNWRISPAYTGEGTAVLETARRHALEGIIAKRLDSTYEPGRRSHAWRKIKLVNRQEFVIGGWIPEKTNLPNRVGALLLGYYEHNRGPGRRRSRPLARLCFAGSVGSGFSDATHRALTRQLHDLAQDENPFEVPLPKVNLRQVRFVRPKLVAEVEYRGLTGGGVLRQAAFKGLRMDKNAAQIVREEPHQTNAADGSGSQQR